MGAKLAFLLTIAALASGCANEASSSTTASTTSAIDAPLLGDEAIEADLGSDVSGILYTSETDAPYDVLKAPANSAPIDADAIRAAFNGVGGSDLQALTGSEVRDFDDWFASDLTLPDGADETEIEYVQRMTLARDVMKANLADLTVVLLSANSFDDGDSVGELHIFIAGHSRTTGAVLALHTLAVWT